MIRRSIQIILVCLMLGVPAGLFAQGVALPSSGDTVKLIYKFVPGDTQRYKLVMTAVTSMKASSPDAGELPKTTAKIVVVSRQTVLKILSSGDAEIEVRVETMRMYGPTGVQDFSPKDLPKYMMVMSTNGEVKSTSGLEKMTKFGGKMGFTNMLNLGGLNQSSSFLPANPVKVGDKWNQEITLPLGGKAKVQSTLLSTDSKVGRYKVAAFSKNVDGIMALTMESSVSRPGATPTPPMSMNGKVLSSGTIYFSPDAGRMVKTDGTGNMEFTLIMGSSGESTAPTMTMDVAIKFEMFLLSTSGK